MKNQEYNFTRTLSAKKKKKENKKGKEKILDCKSLLLATRSFNFRRKKIPTNRNKHTPNF